MSSFSEVRTSLDWLRRHGGLDSRDFTHPDEGEIRVAVERLTAAVETLENISAHVEEAKEGTIPDSDAVQEIAHELEYLARLTPPESGGAKTDD